MALLAECRTLILDRLTGVIGDALGKMGEELTEQAMVSEVNERREVLLDAVMLVRDGRSELETRFRNSFREVFQRRLFPEDAAAASAGSSAPLELSLVSEDSLLGTLEVGKLAQRAGSKLDPEQVLGIRARLATLIDRDWFDETRHPASPDAVFEALTEALDEFSPRPEVKSALLGALEPHVSRDLNDLYSAVNDRLRTGQILPVIKPQVVGAGGRRSMVGAASGAGAAQDEASGGRDWQRGGEPAGGAPSNAHGHSAGHPGAQGAMPPGHGGQGAPDQAAWAGAVMAEFQHAMSEAQSGSAGGRRQVARMLANPSIFGAADIPLEPVGSPLVASLTDLQRDVPDAALQVPAIAQRLREEGSPLDQVTAEIVSLVFDYIYSDRRLPDSIKQQLLRLQVVAVKAALLDRGFFARRQHPLRRLIDRISDLGADPDADTATGSELLAGLSGVVDRVIASFVTDLVVFETGLAEVEALALTEVERRAAALANEQRQAALREALGIATHEARIEIERRLDRDVPEFVSQFLKSWWTEVLARARCSRDPEAGAQAWDVGIRAADYLVWSVQPKQTEEIPRLASVLPGMMRGLNRGLDLIELPAAERQTFFDELLSTHTQVIAAAKKRVAPGQRSASHASVRLQADGTVRFVPPANETVRAVRPPVSDTELADLRRGQRLDIRESSGVRTLKLAWISPARTLYILSRHPHESLTFESHELAARLKDGRIVPSADVITVEKAIDRVTGDASDSIIRATSAAAA